jgi:diaminohydroxyphosphoribosylaminopyrimidine deaminase/5-amino-6-(5-phosphoribosylamino)uracil reductase
VGCVLVRDGRVIGRGATARGGRPHAETEALAQARALGHDTAGATAYVTLEPCDHHGRTPPCTGALIDAGIVRLVCPITDPDPRVSGRGFAALREAGIAVDTGLLADEARTVNQGFLSRIERGRPHVLLKLAATLDGRIATRTGESRWITGPEARRRVHLLRARSDAILVGAGTARADDPMLDVRGIGLGDRAPVRIVADASLSLPLTGRLAATAREIPTWVLHRGTAPAERHDALADLGIETIEVPTQDGWLDMDAALAVLAERGITRLMCEGGGHIAASLLARGLVDEFALFSAGRAIGGDGAPAVRGFGLEHLADAPSMDLVGIERVGPDVLTRWVKAA